MIDVKAAALECGFSAAADLDPATLRFLPEVRSMCRADRCRSFGQKWSCPPGCGELELWRSRAAKYRSGVLLQTIGEREDSLDLEAAKEVSRRNDANFYRLLARLHAQGLDFLPMGAGTCTRCAACTYPDAPCRHPETLAPSMEACGLFVSDVCRSNALPYYYGDRKIAFTCCVLF